MNNEKYCPIVAVDGQQVFSGVSYGLLCYSYEKIEDNISLAQIRFLNTKDAPDVLYIGAKLELYEGNKMVANGEVISNSNFKFNLDTKCLIPFSRLSCEIINTLFFFFNSSLTYGNNAANKCH